MALLTKLVSWSSIVELGIHLCDHCRGEDGRAFKEAFLLGQRCPQNALSFGGREAALNGRLVSASSFAWLKTKQDIDVLEARLHNEMYSLRGEYEYSRAVEELDQFLHGISAYAEKDCDYLMWQSATSGTRIVCVRTTHRSASRGTTYSWMSEYHEGHKPSRYSHLWSQMTM